MAEPTTTPFDDAARVRAARRAYERGRWRWSTARSLEVLPIALSALILGADPSVTVALAGALFAACTLGGWWRRDVGRGAVAGAWVGLAPILIGGGMLFVDGGLTEAQCAAFCLTGSVCLGALAGLTLARRAAGASNGLAYAAAATLSALGAASLGCAAIGFGTIFGLGLSLILVGAPAYWGLQRAPAG